MRQFVAVGLLVLITGCGGNGYRNVNGTMAYQTWDESNGTQTKYLTNADIDSFQLLSNPEYAKDENNVYFRGVRVWNADPDTFQLLDFPYAKDANRAYCGTVPVNTTNLNAFEVLFGSRTVFYYATASEDAYAVEEVNGEGGLVPAGQEIFSGNGWARDDQHCYFSSSKLGGADVETFKALDWRYAKDANNVYYRTSVIPGADVSTFEVHGFSEARDAYGSYSGGERRTRQ